MSTRRGGCYSPTTPIDFTNLPKAQNDMGYISEAPYFSLHCQKCHNLDTRFDDVYCPECGTVVDTHRARPLSFLRGRFPFETPASITFSFLVGVVSFIFIGVGVIIAYFPR